MIEGVQGQATKLVAGMQDFNYNDRLKMLGLQRLEVVLLRYPKPTLKPRFFAKTVRRLNLGFSAIIDGFWAHLHSKIIQKNLVNFT